MSQRASLILLLVATACRSREPGRVQAQLASVHFDVPAHWKRAEARAVPVLSKLRPPTRRGLVTEQWAPADNERKESIVVIRSERSPATARAGASTLEPLLAYSQQSLRDVRASKATQIKTAHGLTGARVDVDFTPPGTAERYHRVHVVLADEEDGSLVHVLYTARNPDQDLTALSIVLDSIRHEEG